MLDKKNTKSPSCSIVISTTKVQVNGDKQRFSVLPSYLAVLVINSLDDATRQKSTYIEVVMNHSIGISDNYLRATSGELLNEYLKAVDYLTISHENKFIII